ncbi:MAG TPA: FAD/NAD(P)-binding protein [Opitutus sp.]|nr:FAD/NAD(P)-binding protein [Opitutus sp.]
MSEDFPPSVRTIAIIGGGFSGAALTIHLLRSAKAPLRIMLIERKPPFGSGVAYGTKSPDHLLNVPANQMGLWADEPDHFVRWLRAQRETEGVPEVFDEQGFLPRRLYGAYIASLLNEADAESADHVELERVEGEVVDLEERSGGGGLLKFRDGTELAADQVVLALGNLPGAYPIPRSLPIYRSSRYVHVPWRADALGGIGPTDEVLLVGQGLTASDLIVELDRRGHRGTIHALSRRGVRPQVHRPVEAYPHFIDKPRLPTTARELVRRVRGEVRAAAERGIDWRGVIDSVRPHAQAIWQGFSETDRSMFLRYVTPLWEGHRHRIAPQLAEVLARLEAAGRLKYLAGRLQSLEADAEGVDALYRRRGSIQHVALRVAKIINCSGPRTDYSKYQHPLFIHLLARGLIDHDPLALGINARPTGEVLRYRGDEVGWMFTLGAPLKGVLWETTSVREIREQAQSLAGRLLANKVGAESAAGSYEV